ncbi:hypothetical protein C8R30_11522 [Nitrosomonas nitrosa]|jgi:hypothetical protein|nr:hypothetical protein C8R30_11522 [Nitrosomonas nitrosa]
MGVRFSNFMALWLFISLFANSLTWALQGEVFMHAFENHQHSPFIVKIMQEDHLHNEFVDKNNSSHFSADTCLKAAYQPFFFTKLSLLTPLSLEENLTKFILQSIPELFLDTLFRPPR